MLSLMVVVVHPTRDLTAEFSNGRVAVEPDLFILQTAPQALDEDVVHPAPFAIHADSYVVGFEFSNPIRPSELAALVGVEDFGFASGGLHRVLECPHAEAAVHGVAQLPGEHGSALPVHDRYEIGVAFFHRDVGDVGAPDLIHFGNFQVS